MRLKRLIVVGGLILALPLAGCSEAGRALISTSIDKVEYGADTAGEALVKAPCAMTAGAYFRLENPNQKKGVELLCDPTAVQGDTDSLLLELGKMLDEGTTSQ